MSRLSKFLYGKTAVPEDVTLMQDKLLFDRIPVRDRYVRFIILIGLSTIISAYGVLADSTATVIGAMIVAPLMTPIMAVSLSIITGDGRNIVRSTLVVAAGAAMVAGFSILLAAIIPGHLSVTSNAQVTSRVTPGLIDWVIALAAGAAGAFATSREDVSDTLPGVAIAVSLVPPLAVIGVCISARQMRMALGAFLLFLTNYLAIVAAGLIVFAIMGYRSAALDQESRKSRRVATIAIVIATVAIMVPLGITGYNIYRTEALQRKGKATVSGWLEETDYEVVSLKAKGKGMDVIIAGEGTLPEFNELLSDLKEKAGKVTIDLKVVPEKHLTGTTDY
jgi:uncharacterized hydrophobic protein (TIGR00271 family)